MEKSYKLIDPPPPDPSKSIIENILELTPVPDLGFNFFTNSRPFCNQVGTVELYGGLIIAQSVSAAQRTVPVNFTIHAMNCYFLLAGNAQAPIIYQVEHIRNGNSFATRTVQARQSDKCIFTAIMSFVKEGSGGSSFLEHEVPKPINAKLPSTATEQPWFAGEPCPVEVVPFEIHNGSGDLHKKVVRHWIKAKGKISKIGGHQAHLSALAFVSDSYFLLTVPLIHSIWPIFNEHTAHLDKSDFVRSALQSPERIENPQNHLHSGTKLPEMGMSVSLNHTIYFHNQRGFRADEWMLSEMSSPWAGDGRGLVTQKIYGKDGRLIATCFQEVENPVLVAPAMLTVLNRVWYD